MAKTAAEHLNSNTRCKVVVLDKNFAGIRAGQKMFVATPRIIADYICAIPSGKTRTIVRMRREMAREEACDALCPVSTSIFLRIVAQAALDELAEGKSIDTVTPFWRVLTSKDKVSKKLSVEPSWVDQRRQLEQEQI